MGTDSKPPWPLPTENRRHYYLDFMNSLNLDKFWLAAAYTMAAQSLDPSTQNGAVLVENNALLAASYNKFPDGISNSPARWNNKSIKYRLVAHAEESACISALKIHGQRVVGSTLYCPWYACSECAKAIIQAGVVRVVGHASVRAFQEHVSDTWTLSTRHALAMLGEAGVACEWLNDPILGTPKIRVGGHLFDPSI